jgi:hypothetical protein
MDSHSRTSGSSDEPDEGSPGVWGALGRARASAPHRTVAGSCLMAAARAPRPVFRRHRAHPVC